MGYCADGNGDVFLRNGINIKELKTKLDNLNRYWFEYIPLN